MTSQISIPLPETAARLRDLHTDFFYKSYSISASPQGLLLVFHFAISPNLDFYPQITIPLRDPSMASKLIADPKVNRLAFLTGMVEMLSYWKLSCPGRIEIECGYLDHSELYFWETLIRKGLGEFFFINKIPPTIDFSIRCHRDKAPESSLRSDRAFIPEDSYLVLVGGGKDSLVTLDLLRRITPSNPLYLNSLVLNPIDASIAAIETAQYATPLKASRTLDPKLRELNSQGYLNGHTPFSALLAFISVLTAYVNGYRYALASNEASASEGNTYFQGVEINHQYSKSYEFERNFRNYIAKLGLGVDYLSFLRPINELQICALFSEMTQYHAIFRSCNREQTLAARTRGSERPTDNPAPPRSGWCANCPKCVFTFLCLSCFLNQREIIEIFGVDPSTQPNFNSFILELAGYANHKPFECVGTYEEVRSCLTQLIDAGQLHPASNLSSINLAQKLANSEIVPLSHLIKRWNNEHFLNDKLELILRDALQPIKRRYLP